MVVDIKSHRSSVEGSCVLCHCVHAKNCLIFFLLNIRISYKNITHRSKLARIVLFPGLIFPSQRRSGDNTRLFRHVKGWDLRDIIFLVRLPPTEQLSLWSMSFTKKSSTYPSRHFIHIQPAEDSLNGDSGAPVAVSESHSPSCDQPWLNPPLPYSR